MFKFNLQLLSHHVMTVMLNETICLSIISWFVLHI